jgi:hypothetical protein
MNDDATIEVTTWLTAFGCILLVLACRVLGVW